jgi:hypothetical protein
MKERKNLRLKVWFIALSAVLIAFGGLSFFVILQKARLSGLESSISSMKEESVPLRFQVMARSGGGIEVKFKFYDEDGKVISVVEHSMAGESLFLDFSTIPVGGRFIAFPKAAFTESIPAEKGISLLEYYDKDGFPQIFASKALDRKTKDGLSALYLQLKLGRQPGGSFGNAVHDIKEIKEFRIGTVYRAVARKKGGIEIVEETE